MNIAKIRISRTLSQKEVAKLLDVSTEVDRAVKALDKARQNAEYSSLYWILRKIVNG